MVERKGILNRLKDKAKQWSRQTTTAMSDDTAERVVETGDALVTRQVDHRLATTIVTAGVLAVAAAERERRRLTRSPDVSKAKKVRKIIYAGGRGAAAGLAASGVVDYAITVAKNKLKKK